MSASPIRRLLALVLALATFVAAATCACAAPAPTRATAACCEKHEDTAPTTSHPHDGRCPHCNGSLRSAVPLDKASSAPDLALATPATARLVELALAPRVQADAVCPAAIALPPPDVLARCCVLLI